MYGRKRLGAWWAVGQVLLVVGSTLVTTQAYPLELQPVQEETLTRPVSPGPRPPPQKKTPVFDQKYLKSHTDGQLRGWVRHMLKQNRAVMPHFSGELNAEEVQQILAYLHSLPPDRPE
jgi:hypothetical protein